ncbi:Hypothetical_protein [Hexamita inflata]|uniref:Hypothetical_protein n=1 Tax=Hexamita inflata TaxID=28002 RepID=A0AA86QD68_9EUKA|nr:Hypothetical protein HINF_LOCUS38514 [Hexamita inflata]
MRGKKSNIQNITLPEYSYLSQMTISSITLVAFVLYLCQQEIVSFLMAIVYVRIYIVSYHNEEKSNIWSMPRIYDIAVVENLHFSRPQITFSSAHREEKKVMTLQFVSSLRCN